MAKRQNESVRATQPEHSGNAADVACVRRIAKGDIESVDELYDRHSIAMYSLAFRILEREPDAKEVLRAVFLQVWREAAQDDAAQGIVAAWLLTLTRNQAIHCLRTSRANIKSPPTFEGDAWRPVSEIDDPPYAMPQFDAPERVREAFNTLPDLERLTIEMTYFKGLGQQELARRLSQPLDTVKTCVRVALLKLRSALTWGAR